MAPAIPKDAFIFRYSDKAWVVYRLEGETLLGYSIDDLNQYDVSGMNVVDRTNSSLDADFGKNVINAGNASELISVAQDFGTMSQYWNHIVQAYMGNNPAKDDPEVRKVLAQLAARPDMGQSELENLLKATNYYKGRTQTQLEWNDLSDAEKAQRINEQAANLASTYLSTVGSTIPYDNPTLRFYAEQIASGKMGAGQVVETWAKPEALKNPESPWSRTLRNEQENQRARGVDVENQTSAVRKIASEWGVQLSDQSLGEWGRKLVTKEASDADLENYLKGQAKILYAWKDENVKTADAAQPWLQAYSRVLEKGATDLFNPVIQQALQQGTPLFEFEKQLKLRPEWLQTGNARETLDAGASAIGRTMGFQ